MAEIIQFPANKIRRTLSKLAEVVISEKLWKGAKWLTWEPRPGGDK